MRSIIRSSPISNRILSIRNQLVMVDRDLAVLYGVKTGPLNQQVKRNRSRFPGDFMFRLTDAEAESIRVRVLGREGSWRGKLPYAFTEQGAGMLAAVLRSPAAARVTIEVLRAFVRLRRNDPPAESSGLDRRYRSLFAAIRDAVLLYSEDKPFTTEVPCTYFVQAGEDGPIKIGSTRNLVARFRALVTMSPLPLRLLGVMEGDHEDDCHTRLGAFRIRGEWFVPSEMVLGFIHSNTIMPSSNKPPHSLDSGRSKPTTEIDTLERAGA